MDWTTIDLPKQDGVFIKLLLRTKDQGDGWRNVSPSIWGLVDMFKTRYLLDIDEENKRVRLSPEGEVLSRFL